MNGARRFKKAIAIFEKLQESRPPPFLKDGGAMLLAIVLDRPLEEAHNLVDQPHQFLQEIKQVLKAKKSHPILERMLRTIQGDVAKQEAWMVTNTNRWKRPGGAPGWLSI